MLSSNAGGESLLAAVQVGKVGRNSSEDEFRFEPFPQFSSNEVLWPGEISVPIMIHLHLLADILLHILASLA